MSNNILQLLEQHNNWRKNCINLIASENVMSPIAEKIYVSDLMHRYAEGMPYKRYYQGLKYFDKIEDIATEFFKQHFQCDFADLRPISGTLANMAVFSALAKTGDNIITSGIDGGAHISHENPGAAGLLGFKITHFKFDQNYNLDLKDAKFKIKKLKPKFIVLGASVIPFPFPVKELKEICKTTNTKIIYDAAHVLGLICNGFFQNPLEEGADIITSSTHKTFPGPQGGLILGNIDNNLQKKIRNKIFPGVLSNHHLHRIPSLYIALSEMKKFGKDYASQIIKNAKTLAEELYNLEFDVLVKERGFTQSHQVLVNMKNKGGGDFVAKKLEEQNIIVNKNIIQGDKLNIANPSGIRIGVQEMTRFLMKQDEMKQIAEFIKKIIIDNKDIKQEVIEFRSKFQDIGFC